MLSSASHGANASRVAPTMAKPDDFLAGCRNVDRLVEVFRAAVEVGAPAGDEAAFL